MPHPAYLFALGLAVMALMGGYLIPGLLIVAMVAHMKRRTM